MGKSHPIAYLSCSAKSNVQEIHHLSSSAQAQDTSSGSGPNWTVLVHNTTTDWSELGPEAFFPPVADLVLTRYSIFDISNDALFFY